MREPLNVYQRREAMARARIYRQRQETALAEWRRDAAEHAANGHSPHYCVHGVNLWVDYDPICQQCEDWGFNGFNPLGHYEQAIFEVRQRTDALTSVIEAVGALSTARIYTPEVREAVTNAMRAKYPSHYVATPPRDPSTYPQEPSHGRKAADWNAALEATRAQ